MSSKALDRLLEVPCLEHRTYSGQRPEAIVDQELFELLMVAIRAAFKYRDSHSAHYRDFNKALNAIEKFAQKKEEREDAAIKQITKDVRIRAGTDPDYHMGPYGVEKHTATCACPGRRRL